MLPDLHQESLEFFNTKILTLARKLDLILRNAHWDATGAPEADRSDHPVRQHHITISTDNCQETITVSHKTYLDKRWDREIEQVFLDAMKKLKNCEQKSSLE